MKWVEFRKQPGKRYRSFSIDNVRDSEVYHTAGESPLLIVLACPILRGEHFSTCTHGAECNVDLTIEFDDDYGFNLRKITELSVILYHLLSTQSKMAQFLS